MSETGLPDSEFDWLANVYNSHGAINHPSELHGLLMGHLAGGKRLSHDSWLDIVVEHMGVERLDTEKQPGLLHDLSDFYEHADQEVAEDSTAFSLLLPDDDFALVERLQALALWVRGFLEGIAIAANEQLARVDEDLQEMLRDLVDISQLDDRVRTNEQAEREFFEICEYVRIAVLNLYAEFNIPEAVPDGEGDNKPTLH